MGDNIKQDKVSDKGKSDNRIKSKMEDKVNEEQSNDQDVNETQVKKRKKPGPKPGPKSKKTKAGDKPKFVKNKPKRGFQSCKKCRLSFEDLPSLIEHSKVVHHGTATSSKKLEIEDRTLEENLEIME